MYIACGARRRGRSTEREETLRDAERGREGEEEEKKAE